MHEKPNDLKNLEVPRAIASAVSDWRRSGGKLGSIWRNGECMIPQRVAEKQKLLSLKSVRGATQFGPCAVAKHGNHRFRWERTWFQPLEGEMDSRITDKFKFGGYGLALAVLTLPITATLSQAVAKPAVEVAFVLDTAGSMSGLLEGAKQKIWSIATSVVDTNPKRSKISSEAVTGDGDLVSAVASGRATLGNVRDDELPDDLRKLSPDQRKAELERRTLARKTLNEKLAILVQKRDAYVTDKKRSAAPAKVSSFDRVVEDTLKAQTKR